MPTANAEVWGTPRGSYSCMQSTEETIEHILWSGWNGDTLRKSDVPRRTPVWVPLVPGRDGLVLCCAGAGPSTVGLLQSARNSPWLVPRS